MIHGSWSGLRRSKRNVPARAPHRHGPTPSRRGTGAAFGDSVTRARYPNGIQIERDTPILPQVIARSVCEEVTVWLGSPLPTQWVSELGGRADTIYAHNERFRRRIRGDGNRGRDYLRMFMRHWLAALLKQRRPDLFARLPASYCVGADPPEVPLPIRAGDSTVGNIRPAGVLR